MAKIIEWPKNSQEPIKVKITEQQKEDLQIFFAIGMEMVKAINKFVEEAKKK